MESIEGEYDNEGRRNPTLLLQTANGYYEQRSLLEQRKQLAAAAFTPVQKVVQEALAIRQQAIQKAMATQQRQMLLRHALRRSERLAARLARFSTSKAERAWRLLAADAQAANFMVKLRQEQETNRAIEQALLARTSGNHCGDYGAQ